MYARTLIQYSYFVRVKVRKQGLAFNYQRIGHYLNHSYQCGIRYREASEKTLQEPSFFLKKA